jgi:UDP-N-acetylmuramate dehydrogenase
MRGILKQNESLARYTSWHVGGVARQTYRPADLQDLREFILTLPDNENIVWLGLGSNVLIRDGGIPGTVILTQGRLNRIEQIEKNIIRAEAGVTCAKMAKFCTKLGYPEGAFFAGVPGTIGGALAMNASAFGGETWPYVVAVETVNRKGEVRLREKKDFKIGYREVTRPADEWFGAGHFLFKEGSVEEAAQKIRELLRQRSATQPIGEFNCGSVFRNPPGDFAARLIEASGLKGFCLGNAWISKKHANFIINGGKATAKEIETLISFVQKSVEEKQGVRLIPEVHIIGEE